MANKGNLVYCAAALINNNNTLTSFTAFEFIALGIITAELLLVYRVGLLYSFTQKLTEKYELM